MEPLSDLELLYAAEVLDGHYRIYEIPNLTEEQQYKIQQFVLKHF